MIISSSGLIIGLIARKMRKKEQKKVINKFDNYDFHLGEMTSRDVPPRFTQRNHKTSKEDKTKWKKK